ncbi:MAG: hypothetical protein ACLFWL_06780 [Candidatus Brocadiia bacterium]
MPDESQKIGIQDAVAVRCEECGSLFRATKWREGLECPKCSSGHVKPEVAPGGAVDYYVADRSEGYAPADIRYSQWAKWSGLITPHQYEIGFIKQNRMIQHGEDPTPIHEIFINEGWITKEQAIRLLEFMCIPRPNEEDGRFIQILRETAEVDQERVEKIHKAQSKAAMKYHEVPPLCQLLVEKRVLGESEMLRILNQIKQRGRGALKIVEELVIKPTKKTRGEKLLKSISYRNPRARNIYIVAVLFLAAMGIWRWQTAENVPKMYVKCKHCGKINKVKWAKELPVRCPNCGNKRAFYAMIGEDGHVFTVKNPYIPHVNPKTGSPDVRALSEEDVKKIRAEKEP